MATDLSPSALFDGYVCDGVKISIPLETLGLTVQSAGDWRRVLYALESHVATYFAGLASADRPEAIVVSTPVLVPERSRDLSGTVQAIFVTTFLIDQTLGTVAGEPV